MDNQEKFEAVCARLMQATGITTEVALAEELGFRPAAFSNRKKRGSLPYDEIDHFISQRQLNPQFIFTGEGPMFEGGEAAAQREQDYRDLVAQMEAISLHNETKTLVRPLIKGLVWGDADGIEQWLESLSGTTPTERSILKAYRTGDPQVRTAMEFIAKHGVAPAAAAPKVKQTFHGSVGQVVEGGMHNSGGMSITVKSAKKQ